MKPINHSTEGTNVDFTIHTLDDPIIDKDMIRHVMETHHNLLVIRQLDNGEEYDRYFVRYVSNVIDSQHLNREINSCKKGDIAVVSHYTGYGYEPHINNTTIHIGIMDVTKEEAEERNLKFADMYRDYKIK